MGSTRLPGKALAQIGDKTALEWVLYQLGRCKENLGVVVVNTTYLEEDDAILEECMRLEVNCSRSDADPDDVLGRFHRTHESWGGDPIVRITADCPFLDPGLLDQVVAMIGTGRYDYVGVEGAPDGYHQEAFTAAALQAANEAATTTDDREHVVPWMIRNGRCRWVRASIEGEPVTLDTPADLERLRAMVA